MPMPLRLVWLVCVMGALSPVANSLKRNNMICNQLRPCVCEYPDGEGVDLTGLMQQNFSIPINATNQVFYLRPCGELQLPCPTGSSLCVVENPTNASMSLGSTSEVSFSSHGIDAELFLLFVHNNLKAEIQLLCSAGNETNLTVASSGLGSKEDAYHLSLNSPEACRRRLSAAADHSGLSAGSTLVILFLVLSSVYLLAGAVANHFLRGATGWEMIPNIEFWRDLPRLCADGLRFALNGCQPPPSYEQI